MKVLTILLALTLMMSCETSEIYCSCQLGTHSEDLPTEGMGGLSCELAGGKPIICE